MNRKIKPLQDYVLIERITHRTSGLLDLDMSMVTDNELFDISVVAIGPDVDIGIKPGDLIECVSNVMALPMHAMTDSGEFHMIRARDIVGVHSFASGDE